jgi:hypothetical protein
MAVRGLGVFVPALTVFVSHGRVFLCLLVIAVLVVIGGLVMMVGSRMVVGRRVVVVLDGWMLSHDGMYLLLGLYRQTHRSL